MFKIKYKNFGGNIFPLYLRKKNYFKIFSMCAYKLESKKFDTKNSYISIQEEKFNIKFLFKKGIKIFKFYFNIYTAKIEYDKLKLLPIQNNIYYHFVGEIDMKCPFLYNAIFLKYSIGSHSKIYDYDNIDLCCYLRQTRGNTLGLTIRNKNYTDKHSFKIFFAWFLSLFSINSKIVLLYEKNNEKYEEGASVLYEKLIDNKVKAYYILNNNSKHWNNIKEKYKKNVIKSFTFKHYFYYFKCRKFIGTESISHALEVRTTNRFVNAKLFLRRFKYVFLQHGVMYMVSLDSKNRSFFRKGSEMPIDSKIVVSSQLEAQHFIELGGFDKEDLYVTGLPNYDKNIKNKDADKIVIMPTWRPWDFNTLESNYKKSSYYKMIKNILKSIPIELKEKIYILPHPLIKNKFNTTDLKEYIPNVICYDKVLEDTDLLITDYSSIAYSAFYRGCNVIFCWKELNECMKEYKGHLMLNEKNVFGDICYSYNDLEDLIQKNYKINQTKEHISKYRKIVEFHDNKNTERLYKFLIRDKFFN